LFSKSFVCQTKGGLYGLMNSKANAVVKIDGGRLSHSISERERKHKISQFIIILNQQRQKKENEMKMSKRRTFYICIACF
jgi:hypothetical protein